MSKFIIQGGHPLQGTIEVQGAKNAATPILAASLLLDEECVLHNIPRIRDVENMIKLLQSLRVDVEWRGRHTLRVYPAKASPTSLDQCLIQSMRSSILLLGPLLARFGEVEISEPGGCLIGNRPIETHLYALKALGAEIKCHSKGELRRIPRKTGKRNVIVRAPHGLRGATIILPEFSVTATENTLMAASRAEGRTVIKLAAAEPYVQDLAHFLNKMGAKIQGIGTHTLTVDGVKKLHGTSHTIIPDPIEAGTFAVAAILTQLGSLKAPPPFKKGLGPTLTRGLGVTIKNIIPEHLDAVLGKLGEIGIQFKVHPVKKSEVSIGVQSSPRKEIRGFYRGSKLKVKNGPVGESPPVTTKIKNLSSLTVFPSKTLHSFHLQTLPYPGFPTDLQALFGLLATQGEGTSLIHDPLFENRFGYLKELQKMGAKIKVLDPHRAQITGPTPLFGREIKSFDLRAGATLIIAGLVAQGKTVIHQAEIVDRGYERIGERLAHLGARIRRVA